MKKHIGIVLFVYLSVNSGASGQLPDGFVDEVMLALHPQLRVPTQLAFLPDNRVLIAERTAGIFIADPNLPGMPIEL